MNPTHEARHMGDRYTIRQKSQEYTARATANADMLMAARGRHAAYITWDPRGRETRPVVQTADVEAVA